MCGSRNGVFQTPCKGNFSGNLIMPALVIHGETLKLSPRRNYLIASYFAVEIVIHTGTETLFLIKMQKRENRSTTHML